MLAWRDYRFSGLAQTMRNKRGLLIVLVMIFSAGVTPIVIRITHSEGMPSLVIVWIRLWLVSFGLAPLVWSRYRRELARLTRRQILLSVIAGFWLSLNLLLLFAALEYTSVLMTSVLRRTTPMWIVLPEIILFGVVFSRRFWLSLVVTLAGVTMVGLGGFSAVEAGSDPLLGGAMALCGSLCFGAYLLIGRQLNNLIPPLLYSFLVFFSSALVTSTFVIGSGTAVIGYPPDSYLWALVVTILAQVLGHVFMNLSLQHFTATAVAIILQVGVVLSAVIALFVFGEIPSLLQVVGSALVIYGVIVTTMEQTRAKWRHQPQS